MKNFLNKLLFLIILSVASQVNTTFANYEVDFYKKLFKEAGLKIDFPFSKLETSKKDLDSNPKEGSRIEFKEGADEIFFDSSLKRNSNIFLTTKDLADVSEFKNWVETDYERFFVVCNSVFKVNLFSCDFNSLNLLDVPVSEFKEEIFQDPDSRITSTLYKFEFEDKYFFIIPENSIQYTVQESMIKDYLSSLNRSLNVSNNQDEKTPGVFILIKEFYESVSFEALTYVIVAFIFLLFLYPLIIFLNNNKIKWDSLGFYSSLEESIYGVYKKNIYLKTFFLVFVISFIGLVVMIYYKVGSKDFRDFFTFLFSDPFEKISGLGYLYLLSLFTISIGILFILSSRLMVFLEIFQNLFRKISKTHVNVDEFKYLYVFFYLVGILTLVSFSKLGSLELLITVFLINIFLLIYTYKARLVFSFLFSKKEKIVIAAITVVLVFFGIWTQFVDFSTSYRFDRLIGISDKIVMLPYQKNTNAEVLIEPTEDYYDFPLFVDEYLIRYPGINRIENKNIKDFEKSTNSIIVSKSEDSLLQALVDKEPIFDMLIEDGTSSIFYIPPVVGLQHRLNLRAVFTIDCKKLRNVNLYAENYLDSSKKQTLDFGNLLGCSDDQEVFSFELPKSFEATRSNILFFKALDEGVIKKIDIFSNELKVPFKRFKISSNNLFSFVDLRVEKTEDVKVFMTGDLQNYVIDNSNSKNPSYYINDLKIKRFINDNFIIWTTAPYQIIKNNYYVTPKENLIY